MQAGFNLLVPLPVETLGQRIAYARELRDGMTQTELAARSGVKQSDISKLQTGRSRSTKGIARLAAALRVSALWLELGEGDPPTAEDEPSDPPLAHRLSHPNFDTAPLTQEVVMKLGKVGQLPQEFVFAVPDGSLGAATPKGTLFVWATNREPTPERLVLVLDKYGNVHARE